jgi:membrane protein
MADQCTDQAAALTYYSVLALFPALLALVSLLGVFGQGESTVNAMLDMVRSLGQERAADVLEDPVRQMVTAQGAGIGLVVGLVIALWSASGYVGAFGRAMNRVYEVDEGRPIWKLRPLQLFITFICVMAMALVLMAVVVSGPVARAVGDALGIGEGAVTAFNIIKWPVILAVVVVIVALLYYATPNVRQPRFRWISVGAAIGIGVWLLASIGFGFYVGNFSSYNKTYGSLAGVIVFLLWLWLTNLALLFGAEVDSELERARELESGIQAEETLQLPPRDTSKSEKAAAKLEESIAEGRAIRQAAEEAQAVEAGQADEAAGEAGGAAAGNPDADPDGRRSTAGLALGVAGGAAQNAVNKVLRRKG